MPWKYRIAEYLYYRKRALHLWLKEHILRKEVDKWDRHVFGILWIPSDPNLLYEDDRYAYLLRKQTERFRHPIWYRKAKRRQWLRWKCLFRLAADMGLRGLADRWSWRIDPRRMAPAWVTKNGFRYVLQPDLTYPQGELLGMSLQVWTIPQVRELAGRAYVPYAMYEEWFNAWQAKGFPMRMERF